MLNIIYSDRSIGKALEFYTMREKPTYDHKLNPQHFFN